LAAVPCNLVAEIAGRAVGMVSCTSPDAGAAELISLWVAPEARGQGVGDSLIEAVVAWAARQGADRVVLAVWQANRQAIALYQRHGFRDTGPSPSAARARASDPPDLERRMVRPTAAP
jgi:ribosomal protein S18 acetylase RimI-like enzyme